MSKECKLISTLPNLNDKRSLEEMLSFDEISEYRFNSGVNQLMSTREIMERLKQIEEQTKKKVWIDIKGRQLRVETWANPSYEAIELNHEIEIEYPARVIFRDGTTSEIIRCRGNKILLSNSPYHALGKGQSINIDAKSLEIKGYLTEQDKELISMSKEYDLNNYMASFVEEMNDLIEIIKRNKKANIVAKIESIKGLKFILENTLTLNTMSARDDLYTSLNHSYQTIRYLKEIIKKDPNAICASRIFESLQKQQHISLSDFEDLELMYQFGYRTFMLQDDIKGETLKRTIKGWSEFIDG